MDLSVCQSLKRSKLIVPNSDDIEENWIPSDKTELAHIEVELTEEELEMVCMEEVPTEEEILECKWRRLRKPRNPVPENHISSYLPPPGERLVNKFKDMGLQIIVKMASIELTPEKPEFPVGGWHVEGQMNERICATALYYLDNENISPSSLSFRMQTSPYINEDIDVGQENYKWLEFAYGTTLGGGNSPCLQNYGTVETKQGRLLAFPNVL